MVSEEIETINKEFEGVMEKANRYISEYTGRYHERNITLIKQEKPAVSERSFGSRTYEKIKKKVKQKQIKLMNAPKKTRRKVQVGKSSTGTGVIISKKNIRRAK